MEVQPIVLRWRSLLVLAAGLVAVLGLAGVARADDGKLLGPGAVFTQSNDPAGNSVLVFSRDGHGALTAAGQVPTGGNGRAGNPPLGLPFLDTAGDVELSSDGDQKKCLFVTNAGSDTVSSFRVREDGIQLADVEPTGGVRPISLTSNRRGPMQLVLYVLNSDFGGGSIQGYTVSDKCALTAIPGAHRLTVPGNLPAQIAFNERGTVLAVAERGFPASNGFIEIFPVDRNGLAGTPTVNPSPQPDPYGIAWTKRDQLTVTNANYPTGGAGSTANSYQLAAGNTLVPVGPALPAPGAACWNVITDNGKFLYTTQPAGQYTPFASIDIFAIGKDGALSPGPHGQNVLIPNQNAVDEGLSHDSRYLYVLSDQLLPAAGPASAINEYAVDNETGALTPIGVIPAQASNSTSGLAAW
jgi:6-phosphogluconolactonase